MLTSLIVIHLLKSKHVAKDICNSLYLYIVNVNGQITWIVELQFIVYMVQLIFNY
jgi:hypothetical protein